MKFTLESTIKDVVVREIEEGFLSAIQEQIKCARERPRNCQVLGVDMFDSDIHSFVRFANGKESGVIPKELEPEWLSKIDAILDEVKANLYPPKEE